MLSNKVNTIENLILFRIKMKIVQLMVFEEVRVNGSTWLAIASNGANIPTFRDGKGCGIRVERHKL